jgi:hypothetical protein
MARFVRVGLVLLILTLGLQAVSAQSCGFVTVALPGGGTAVMAAVPCTAAASAAQTLNSQFAAAQQQMQVFQQRIQSINNAMNMPSWVRDQMNAQRQQMQYAINAAQAVAAGRASVASVAPTVTIIWNGTVPSQIVFRFGPCTTAILLGNTPSTAFRIVTVCRN